MKRFSHREALDSGCTGDYAQIERNESHVSLEANEWDSALGIFRTVTLYLTPAEARYLSEQLARFVIEMEFADFSDNTGA